MDENQLQAVLLLLGVLKELQNGPLKDASVNISNLRFCVTDSEQYYIIEPDMNGFYLSHDSGE